MISQISRYARRGVIAIALVAGVSAPAFGAPATLAQTPATVPASPALQPLLIQEEGGSGRDSNYCRRTGRCGNDDRWRASRLDRDGDHFLRLDRGHRFWRNHDRRWNRKWRNDRRWHRNRRSHADFGIYLDLSPRPYYVKPAPVYRYRLNDAHVAWCYDRWRSYRAWDNSYQPEHGRRRQCWSPYS